MVAAIIVAALGGAAWYQARAELRHFQIDELTPIAVSLQEDQELLRALRADSAVEKDSEILASYLAKIRADGLPKHAEMKQRLDRLAENNSTIVALINVYLAHAQSSAFRAQAYKFEHYAIAWRDRWNSVMELFMAGGNYPVAEVPFPPEFIGVLQAEMEAVQHAF